jgi:uncharacterized protein DUF3309
MAEHAAEGFGEGVHFCSDTASAAPIHYSQSMVAARCRGPHISTRGNDAMSLGTILLIILVIALVGGFSGVGGGLFYGTGYYGGGGLGLVLVIVLVLLLLGRI